MPITSKEMSHRKGGEGHVPMGSSSARGVELEDILPKRYETFSADNGWVQYMRCSLLGFEAGTKPSKEDINTSECFVP